MSRRVVTLLIGSLLLPLGCGGTSSPPSPPGPRVDDNRTDPNAPLVLQPGELCSDHTGYVIATFEDASLQAAIRAELSLGAQDLTCGLISGLTVLNASSAGIESLAGIQNLTSLTELNLGDNSITDISALSGLTSLTTLFLFRNSITDISALSGLTSLTNLDLGSNSISDISALSGLTILADLSLDSNRDLTNIQPLLDNAGLDTFAEVDLTNTNVSCADVAALEAKGVTVESDCP